MGPYCWKPLSPPLRHSGQIQKPTSSSIFWSEIPYRTMTMVRGTSNRPQNDIFVHFSPHHTNPTYKYKQLLHFISILLFIFLSIRFSILVGDIILLLSLAPVLGLDSSLQAPPRNFCLVLSGASGKGFLKG